MSFIKKHKRSLIAILSIAVVLIIVFFFEGTTNEPVVDDELWQTEDVSQMTGPADDPKETEHEVAESKEEVRTEEPEESVIAENAEDDISNTHEIIPDAQSADVPTDEAEPEIELETEQEDLNNELICTLSVKCDAAIGRAEGKESIIPENGIVYSGQAVIFTEGESVFDILLREMKKNNIHLEFEKTPVYNSVYIEGIGNLYEFDCGERSGWKYKVNGQFPSVGCSQYEIKKGDIIEWVYTCD